MKTIDTFAYVSSLRELTETGQEVSMTIAGSSMSPFLGDRRDSILFKKPDRPLKKGDMVFYQRRNGQYVMHRICRVRPEGLYIVGDAQTAIEGPVAPEQVFAIITKVCRKGKWIDEKSLVWQFFRVVWIRVIPFRPLLARLYGPVYRLRHRR